MSFEIVCIVAALAFGAIAVCWLFDDTEKRKQQRALEADDKLHEHSGIAWKELHERRQAVSSPKRKKHGNAA